MGGQHKVEKFIEVVLVARCKLRIPDDQPHYSHLEAADYLGPALAYGMALKDGYDEVLDSTVYMAGEFRDAIKDEDVAGGIGL